MNYSSSDIDQLRNNIDFASIAQFFHTFQSAFRPWPVTTHDIIYSRIIDPNDYVFETEDLEHMILDPSERIRLEDLMVRMLRIVTGKRFINSTTWQSHLSKEFDKREFEQENPLINFDLMEQEQPTEQEKLPVEEKIEPNGTHDEPVVAPQQLPPPPTAETKKAASINYFDLPLDTRVHLLHLLCEWQLDEPDKLREHLDNEEEAIQWRVDPVGFDRKGSTFWLFDDNRLYKETPKPKVSKKKSNTTNKRKRGSAAMAPPAPPTEDAPITRRSSRRTQPPPPLTAKGGRGKKLLIQEEEEEESEEEGEWMPWKLICLTKQDWEQISLQYAHSKNLDEQRFYTLLVDDLIPKIIPVLEDREKEIKKQEAIMHRKRSSRIMIKELEALERASSYDETELAPSHSSMAIDDKNKSRASNRLERNNLEKEQREAELAARAREERLLERERRIAEREYRALLREKRQEEGGDGEPLPTFEVFLNPELAAIQAAAAEAEAKAKAEANVKVEAKDQLKDKSKVKKRSKTDKESEKEKKPRKKYEKKPKFDADGNPIPKKPRKPKLDEFGNPIPLKKRGRKPKNKELAEDDWIFDCSGCGVSGKNLDDGTPMIACEKCSVWQHIACLEKSGQVEKNKSLDDISFVCHQCENAVDVDGEDEQPVYKRQRLEYGGETMEYQHTGAANVTLPPIQQSSWQQPSAVRGGYATLHNGGGDGYYQAPPLPPIRIQPQPSQQQPFASAEAGIHSSALPYRDTTSSATSLSSPSSTLVEPPTPCRYPSPSPSPASQNRPSTPVYHQQQPSSYYSQQQQYTQLQSSPIRQSIPAPQQYVEQGQQQLASIPYSGRQTAPVSTPPPRLPPINTVQQLAPVVTALPTQPIQAIAAPTPPMSSQQSAVVPPSALAVPSQSKSEQPSLIMPDVSQQEQESSAVTQQLPHK